jgi:limonene-1,2-epoxide hydrolase
VPDPIQAVRLLVEAWEQGDFTPQPGVTTDDLVLTGLTADGHERFEGAGEIAAYMRRIFDQFSDYRIDVAAITEVDDSHVLLEGHQYATGRQHRPDGRHPVHRVRDPRRPRQRPALPPPA